MVIVIVIPCVRSTMHGMLLHSILHVTLHNGACACHCIRKATLSALFGGSGSWPARFSIMRRMCASFALRDSLG